ncbi:hypothetical protein NEOLEDRAFT_1134825 [Neolentinus lepideus HHB14362 ss-1]|uniref:Uncharacterized protein n=1 Tax=Neolentinus lepideus HHB14362 ss-1 TaxID=1314782 RepID=A0A165RZ77_9AGAM|nr:hypothetical protein NEOLEDRAFT_1134825 [Neolentinus lepideus HHB14362 ss-1]
MYKPRRPHGHSVSLSLDEGTDSHISGDGSPQRTSFVFISSRAPVSSDRVVTLPFRHQPRLFQEHLLFRGRGAYDYKHAVSNTAAAGSSKLPSGFISLHSPSLLADQRLFSTPNDSSSFHDDAPGNSNDPSTQAVPSEHSPGLTQASSMPILPPRARTFPLLPSSFRDMTSSSSSTLAWPDFDDSESEKRLDVVNVASDLVTNEASQNCQGTSSIPVEKWATQKATHQGRARTHSTVCHRPSPLSDSETERNLSLTEICEIFHLGSPAKMGFQATAFAPMPLARRRLTASSRTASLIDGNTLEESRVNPEDAV